jgi:anti-sigma B factor antagonist
MILSIETRQVNPDVTVVELIGRMSLGNQLIQAEDKIKKLIADGASKMVIDVKELSYVDSAAIGVMVMLYGTMSKKGGKMRIAGPNSVVGKIFEITQLQRIIPIDPDVESAAKNIS